MAASAQATGDVRDSGAGLAMPSPMAMFLGLIAHLARLMATPGAIRSFAHFCQIWRDIDAQVLRYVFAEMRKLDPDMPPLNPDDFDLVWNADGTDFDIVHWSEAEAISQRDRLMSIRQYLACARAWHRYYYMWAATRFKWRSAWVVSTVISTCRAAASAGLRGFTPAPEIASARAPP